MSQVSTNQPLGTPTWMELAVPDVAAAQAFYGAVFGWDFDGDVCLVRGLPVAGLREGSEGGWTVHFATDDCDGTAKRMVAAGGTVHTEPHEADGRRAAIVTDPAGLRIGLWQGRTAPGCQLVNEVGALVRNDLVTPEPQVVRDFYTTVFDFTLDANDDLPGLDFTFLRRPDGHEIGGIIGVPEAPAPAWVSTFEVSDTDDTVDRARKAGGTATEPEDTIYTRSSTITDPFGTEFSVGSRP
jgi:predicted enzyme related to lactoylglutathione lyase